MSDAEVQSLREWLANWSDGPHWADATGATVPIAKTTLKALLDERDDWKRRAAKHGCDVERGDPDCG